MFVIPCKYSATSNSVIELCRQIREFHPNEKICVVDSDSSDKSYFDKIKEYDVIVMDIANKNWMVGAYWAGYLAHPSEDFYFFFHDSMKVKANLDYLKCSDLFLFATFDRQVAPSFNSWNDRIANETLIDKKYIKREGKGCCGPIWGCRGHLMDRLCKANFDVLMPSNKAETGYCEGSYGLALESLGYDLNACSLFGDILKLEEPGGKSNPDGNGPPFKTDWMWPIEKFYNSHNDKERGWE